jgi:hypothetical protein
VDWDYTIVSVVSLASLTLFCTNGLPRFPESQVEIVAVVLTAALPVLWAPFLLGLVATPQCDDRVLLFDRHASNTTLPSGGGAGFRTNDTVVDEAVWLMALGVVFSGCGSAILMLYLVVDAVGSVQGVMEEVVDPRVHAAVAVLVLLFYTGGGIAVHDADSLHSDNDWASNAINTNTVRTQCTAGTGSVFDRPLAAESRQHLADLNTVMFSVALLALLSCAVLATYSFFIDFSDKVIAGIITFCGIAFVLVHLLATFTISQAVSVGSNPVCAKATLGGDGDGSRGLVTVAYGLAGIVFYTLVATPYFPHVDPDEKAIVGPGINESPLTQPLPVIVMQPAEPLTPKVSEVEPSETPTSYVVPRVPSPTEPQQYNYDYASENRMPIGDRQSLGPNGKVETAYVVPRVPSPSEPRPYTYDYASEYRMPIGDRQSSGPYDKVEGRSMGGPPTSDIYQNSIPVIEHPRAVVEEVDDDAESEDSWDADNSTFRQRGDSTRV